MLLAWSRYLALVFAIGLGLGEAVINWGDWQYPPLWIVDYVIVAWLLWAFVKTRRGGHLHALLSGWAFTAGIFYMALFVSLDPEMAVDIKTHSILLILIALMLGLSIIGFICGLTHNPCPTTRRRRAQAAGLSLIHVITSYHRVHENRPDRLLRTHRAFVRESCRLYQCRPAIRTRLSRFSPVWTPMTLDILIARWVAILWLICGLSHALFPAKWAALLWPLRDRDTGGFILAAMSLPVGLIIILGHNIWVWDLPVIVTLAGWMTTLKSVVYLLFPRAHTFVMRSSERMTGERIDRGIRTVGIVMIVLGALTAYDSFYRR